MAAWVCAECTTTYAVGAPRCPHCGSTDYTEDGAMPKITRHGGPTIAGASVVAGGWSSEGDPDEWPDLSTEGGEESSPGNSSSPSEQKPSTEPETKSGGSRKRARTTGSRSTAGRTEDSSAPSTDGGREAGGSETGSAAE